jgi:hypothetical protein
MKIVLFILCLVLQPLLASAAVVLNWQHPDDPLNPDGPVRWYSVYRMTGSACLTTTPITLKVLEPSGEPVFISAPNYQVTPPPLPPTTWTDPTTYAPTDVVCYEITANNYFGESPHSNRATVNGAPTPDIPGAPRGLSISPVTP